MAVAWKKPVDENVPWDQKLANYAGNKDMGRTEYQRALEVYRGKSALGDTQGANQAKTWSDQVNTAIGGIGDNRTAQMNNANDTIGQKINATPFEFKQTQAPFQYNNPQADPLYQTALKQAQLGAQTAGNDAMVSLGSRGIGNSSITSDRVAQIQQKAVGDVNATVLPQLMQQAYGRYQDQNNNDYKNQLMNYQAGQDQIGNMSKYATTLNGLNQQDFSNNLATNQDTRAGQAQDATFTGNYNDPHAAAIQKLMASNSAAYGTASPEEQQRLHEQNIALAKSIGGVDTTGNGDYSFGQGQRTMAGKQADITTAEAQLKLDQLKDPNSYANQQLKAQLGLTNAQAEYYKDHGNYYDARAYGGSGNGSSTANQQVSQLMKVWQNTGKAPAGIPGVQEGTPLAGKQKTPKQTTPKATDYKLNPNFASDVSHFKQKPGDKSLLDSNAEDFINEYGNDGYLALRKAAGLK